MSHRGSITISTLPLRGLVGFLHPGTVKTVAAPQAKDVDGKPGSLEAIAFCTPHRGWVEGEGIILATTDGGHTWKRQYSGAEDIQQFSFVTDTIG